MNLTIIIPCYNASKYIERSIDSVLPYDENKFLYEILIVNDGSTDDSVTKIKPYLSKYGFIKLINKPNGGVSSAINLGIDNATGDYIFVLAADDWCDLKTIFKSLEIAYKKKLDLIAFGMEFIDESMNKIGIKNIYNGPFYKIIAGIECLYYDYQPSSICLFLMNKHFFANPGLRFYNGTQNDVEISTKLMLQSDRVYFTREIGYYYYRNKGSITMSTDTDKLKSYLSDVIKVADSNTRNIKSEFPRKLKNILLKNRNSITWNLIWRFISKSKEVDYNFKLECLNELKEKGLYPINGPLKTNFQKFSTFFFNQEWFLKLFF